MAGDGGRLREVAGDGGRWRESIGMEEHGRAWESIGMGEYGKAWESIGDHGRSRELVLSPTCEMARLRDVSYASS